MNLDRFAMQGVQTATFPKFVLPRHGPIFAAGQQFLAHAFMRDGFCYKDVVQPFLVSAWLGTSPACAVLKIKPNIAHVAFAMLQRKWLYPSIVGRQSSDLPAMMVEGLLMAEAAIDAVPGESVAFDDLVDGGGLEGALARLYPDEAIGCAARARDADRRRDEVLGRRTHELYGQLTELETQLRAGAARG